ncbi:pyridoxal phosphate-dependent aminotransferase family protein [Mycoplasmatota bacterium]|nr:pyridoxal phosphate-dependent aminotransferase family protein [Mycoplasmatota bacterium]
MDIFKKAYEYNAPEQVKKLGLYPFFKEFDSGEGCELTLDGKKIFMMGSNNYLGLAQDQRVKEASINAIKQYGTGCSGSRFMNGTLKLHIKLEEKLAKFLNKDACIAFSTGFQANLGIIPSVASKGDYIIGDRANHASIVEGCRLSFAKLAKYKHSDMEDLERILKSIPEDKGKLIITDGVFSMEGEICKLPEIVELAKKYNARVMVDDAHGVGVIGPNGRGTAAYFDLEDEVDLIVGTFSKSFASLGGFVVGSKEVMNHAMHVARSFIFSASIPPSNAAAALEAIKILEEEPERITRVNENAKFFKEGLEAIGLECGETETPIIPIMIYDDMKTFFVTKSLLDNGVYVNPVIPPAVPEGQSLLRTSVTATQTKEQLAKILDIIKMVFTETE